MSITTPTTILKINVARKLRLNTEPIAPITPPKIKKEISRPTWNKKCGLVRLAP